MKLLPGRIAVDPKTVGGKPFFKGTRIPVYVVLEMLANQEAPKDIFSAYPNLTEQDLRDALVYARNLAEVPASPTAAQTLKVLIDNNLPFWWASHLRRDGTDATHVLECQMADKTDDDIRTRFGLEPIVLISRDSDFWHNCPPPWSLIWIRLQNPRIADLSTWIYQTVLRLAREIEPHGRYIISEDGVIQLPRPSMQFLPDPPVRRVFDGPAGWVREF